MNATGKGRGLSFRTKILAALGALAVTGGGIAAAVTGLGGSVPAPEEETVLTLSKIPAFWPSAFVAEQYEEPPFEDDPSRTNNAFNVQDFGDQGSNGWFYRYGDSNKPHRSRQITQFSDGRYFQPGANGLEIKQTFIHTSQEASPMLEWRVAQDGAVNVAVTYVKNVNGDANPGYPDGVQLMIYKGEELLRLENVDISTETEKLAQLFVDALEVQKGESLYFVVDPRANNAFDGGSLYIQISDVNAPAAAVTPEAGRKDNNANSQSDFGAQGSNGWMYLYGTQPDNCKPVSHENNGEYINATSPQPDHLSGLHPSRPQ